MTISKPLQFGVYGVLWNLGIFALKRTTGLGVIDFALNIIRGSTAERTIKNHSFHSRKRELTVAQREHVEGLKARLGITRQIEFLCESTENPDVGFVENRLYTNRMGFCCYGSNWPENLPAYISSRSDLIIKLLNPQDYPTNYSCYTTALLHEFVHIKHRHGKIHQKQLLWGICSLVAAVAAGYFIGSLIPFSCGCIAGKYLGMGIGSLTGIWLSNLVAGVLQLRMKRRAIEEAAQASTCKELRSFLRVHERVSKFDIPYWKLPLTRCWEWRDATANIKKRLEEIFKEKSRESLATQSFETTDDVLLPSAIPMTNEKDDEGAPICPITGNSILPDLRTIFYHHRPGCAKPYLATYYEREAILNWLQKSSTDPQTRNRIGSMVNEQGTLVYPAYANLENYAIDEDNFSYPHDSKEWLRELRKNYKMSLVNFPNIVHQ